MERIVLKFAEGDYVNPDATENVISYIMRLEKPDLVGGVGIFPFEKEMIIRQFYAVKNYYGKTGGKQIIHAVFSLDRSVFNLQEVKELGYRISKYFGDSRQIVFSVHDDTRKQHIHMGINTVAFTNGEYKAFFDQWELKTYAENCMNEMEERKWLGRGLTTANSMKYTIPRNRFTGTL